MIDKGPFSYFDAEKALNQTDAETINIQFSHMQEGERVSLQQALDLIKQAKIKFPEGNVLHITTLPSSSVELLVSTREGIRR